MGDFQALSVSPTCLQLCPKVFLKSRHGYVPKVLSTPFRAQVISLSALPPSDEDQELKLICPIRALKIYMEHSALFKQSDKLCVCFGNHTKGRPVMKQRLSRWIVDTITLAYSSLDLHCPIGVRAHSTRGVASSWAWSCWVSVAEICIFLDVVKNMYTRHWPLLFLSKHNSNNEHVMMNKQLITEWELREIER